MCVVRIFKMSENFWKPYRVGNNKYLPAITNARWVQRFQIGSYIAVVGTDCQSVGPVCYYHIMYIFSEDDDRPYLTVSAEYSSDLNSDDMPFLTLFFGGAHFNIGSSRDYKDLQVFTQKALEIIIKPLGLTTETPIDLPLE
jgi:hypothetical protein